MTNRLRVALTRLMNGIAIYITAQGENMTETLF